MDPQAAQAAVEAFNVFNHFLKQIAIIGLIGATIWIVILYLQHTALFGSIDRQNKRK